MEKDSRWVNGPDNEDQGGKRPSTKKKHINDGDETTGYGKKRPPQDEKESGSGLEEYTGTKAEGEDFDEDDDK